MSVALQSTTGDSLVHSLKSSCSLLHLFSLPIFLMAWGLLLTDMSLNFKVLLFCCRCNVWCCMFCVWAVSPPAPCHPCLAPGQCRDNVRARKAAPGTWTPPPPSPGLLPEHWTMLTTTTLLTFSSPAPTSFTDTVLYHTTTLYGVEWMML